MACAKNSSSETKVSLLLDAIVQWSDEEKSNFFRLLRDANERVCREEHDIIENNLSKLQETYRKACCKREHPELFGEYPELFGKARTEMACESEEFQVLVEDPFKPDSLKK
jgi:hypothetical protein